MSAARAAPMIRFTRLPGFLKDARSALCTAAATILAAGCAHRPPPSLHTTKLVVLRAEGAAQPFVRARVAGHPLLLIVDTGAAQSLLPVGFVRKHQLPTRSSSANPTLIDVHGTRLSMPRAGGVKVQFEGETTFDEVDFLVNTADPSETSGILSPQTLVRSGWALVLDFEREELRYEPEEAALKRLAEAGAALTEVDYHSCELDNHRVTSATVNGVRSSMLLDTGATHTFLNRNNEAIPSMLALKGKRDTATGIVSSGSDLVVGGIHIGFAGAAFEVTASVLPVSGMCGKGAIGADGLGRCIIVWGSRALWVSCRAPPTGE